MKKVYDKRLKEEVAETIRRFDNPDDAADEVVEHLRSTQDAGGMKICQHDNQ